MNNYMIRLSVFVVGLVLSISGCSVNVENPGVNHKDSNKSIKDKNSEVLTDNVRQLRVDNAWNILRKVKADGTIEPLDKGDILVPGDYSLETGLDSSATFDIGGDVAGSIVKLMLGPNTKVKIEELSIKPDGSRISILALEKGQASFSVRGFTHEESEFKMTSDKQNGKSIAAVRGTEFGLSVNPANNNLALSVKEGKVELSRVVNGKVVHKTECKTSEQVRMTSDGKIKMIQTLNDNPQPIFKLDKLEDNHFRIEGNINPHNTLYIQDTPIDTNAENGEFTHEFYTVNGNESRRIEVITPLGNRRKYKVHTTRIDQKSPIIESD